jgi:agmatine deiminase
LEGGSLSTNGLDTAIIVEGTVLNSNRNPGLDKAGAERMLRELLGIEVVIWLPYGLLGDSDTDGHVDNVAVFVSATKVLAQAPPGPNHPDAARLHANLAVLNRARTADGQSLEVIEVPWLPTSPLDPTRPCSYINIYPLNGQVLIPSVDDPKDEEAAALISSLFPGRTPHLTSSAALAYGGGGPHCMTMQLPAPKVCR